MEVETALIEFKDVTKRFGDNTVLDKVNLYIHQGHITTIIGKSGTGKSVLLKHIIGLLFPDEGTVLFNGRPVHEMTKREWDSYSSRISYMFQNNALFDSMTVFDNVALPLNQTTNLSRKEIEQKVMNRIEQTELTEVTFKYPSELSGGMQKRVALARALVTDPEIVLFDEPTTGQDPIRKNIILSMIAQYKRKFGFTAVIISHDIPDIFFISDRILLLWEGKIGFQGSYEEAIKMKHPMIDELFRSLEGFQDELTGLLSKQMFRSRYTMTLEHGLADTSVTAILFSVELDLITEAMGPRAALEVVKFLGEYVNEHLGALGGFSARQSRDHILTILPHAELDDARQLLDNFAKGLRDHALFDIQAAAQTKIEATQCFEIYVYAGVTEARSNDSLEDIVTRAKAHQRIIAIHRCGTPEVKAV
jgi:phospholipid/cholesterol/gamma-HCH transport system ATP-binding protein